MKKITMLAFFSFCAIGFSQSVELPAAYFNNSATTIGENAGGPLNTGPRDTNLPFTGTYYGNMAPNAMLYDNGPYWNTPGSPNVSLLESSLGMNTLGSGVQYSAGNSVADDVVFPDDVEVTSIDVFTYQTGTNPPSITGIYLQVWDGDPTGSGTVIWGNLSDNILGDNVYADANRASETSPGDTSRQIQKVTATTTGLTLTAGTYWIEYSLEGSGSSGPWAPPISILGETTTGNALQNQNGLWVPLEDSGLFTPQGLPFVMYGDVLSVTNHSLSGFNFYPNPTTDMVHFSASKNIESVAIYNLLGQIVMTNNIGATSSSINLSGLATGTYIMKATVEGETGTYKIMKN